MAIDYARMSRTFRTHKARLTRAMNSGDLKKVEEACRAAIAEWNACGAWPDDWAHWQRSLDDAYNRFGRDEGLDWRSAPRLADLQPYLMRSMVPVPFARSGAIGPSGVREANILARHGDPESVGVLGHTSPMPTPGDAALLDARTQVAAGTLTEEGPLTLAGLRRYRFPA